MTMGVGELESRRETAKKIVNSMRIVVSGLEKMSIMWPSYMVEVTDTAFSSIGPNRRARAIGEVG